MFKDIIFGLLFSFIYVIFINKSVSLFLSDMTYGDRFQQSILIIFMIAILSLTLAYTVFSKHDVYKNDVVKLGLTFGSIWIIFHSLFINWNIINEEMKLLVIGVIFGIIIWCSYGYHTGKISASEKKSKDAKTDKKIADKKKEAAIDIELKKMEQIVNVETFESDPSNFEFDFN